jgi:hypothetical protein
MKGKTGNSGGKKETGGLEEKRSKFYGHSLLI